MGVTDEFKTGSVLSRLALDARMLTNPMHLRDMFNGYAFPVLSNGVTSRVRTVPDAPYSTFHIMVAAGAQNDLPGKERTAHFLEHMVFTQNETMRREIEESLKARGGQFNAQTNNGWTRYELRILNEGDNEEYAADLMARAIFGIKIDPAELEHEKTVILDEIRVNAARKRENTVLSAVLAATGKQAAADVIAGNAESLASISVDDLMAFKDAQYASKAVTVEYTGQKEPLAAVHMMQKYFGGLPRGRTPEHAPLRNELQEISGDGQDIKHDSDAVQANYALALLLKKNANISLEQRAIFAAYLNGRMQDSMRGQGERYAYYQEVQMTGDAMGRCGVALMGSALPEHANRALRVFAGHLQDLAQGRVDSAAMAAAIGQARLERAKNNADTQSSDVFIERPAERTSRYQQIDQAYKDVTPECLIMQARLSMDPGLCVRGNAAGVMELAEIKPLLPGTAIAGAATAQRKADWGIA